MNVVPVVMVGMSRVKVARPMVRVGEDATERRGSCLNCAEARAFALCSWSVDMFNEIPIVCLHC